MSDLNFAVMRGGFGDLWIAKTKLSVKDGSIYSTFDEAQQRAIDLNDSVENLLDLQEASLHEELQEIEEDMERWII